MIHPMRVITVHGVKYLRADDVASYVREIAGTEETDVRRRLEEAAANLAKPVPLAKP